MQIDILKLENFRNYPLLDIEFSPKTNIIYGDNGQGKTNILEAIYICGFGKSYRQSQERETINTDAKEAHIRAEFFAGHTKKRFDVHIKKNETKGVAVNQIPIKRLRDLFGQVNIVMFSPEDMEIIKRGPSARRNYLNLEICQIDHIYADDLISYTKILKQRNGLLKEIEKNNDPALTETLDVWDLQLTEYGKKLISRRKKYLEEMNEYILDIHYDISGGKEKVELIYEPNTDEDDLYEELLRAREKDKIYKNTSVGPHRDDFSFYVNGKDAKIYGSQGQQRTAILSLKLSELKMIEEKTGEKPILLLDDVLSELDRNRQEELIKRIEGIQTIITTTGIDEFVEKGLSDIKKFLINDAQIIKNA